MEIKVGKYTLKSDRFCCWLEKESKGKDGKIRQARVSGYFRDFGMLLDDFIDRRVKDSDANDMKQALAEIDASLKDAKKIAREAVKGNFKIIERNAK